MQYSSRFLDTEYHSKLILIKLHYRLNLSVLKYLVLIGIVPVTITLPVPLKFIQPPRKSEIVPQPP